MTNKTPAVLEYDETGYVILDSDHDFTAWLASLDPLTMHPSGLPTTVAIATAYHHLVPDLSSTNLRRRATPRRRQEAS